MFFFSVHNLIGAGIDCRLANQDLISSRDRYFYIHHHVQINSKATQTPIKGKLLKAFEC
jgi:hypothetical protein